MQQISVISKVKYYFNKIIPLYTVNIIVKIILVSFIITNKHSIFSKNYNNKRRYFV